MPYRPNSSAICGHLRAGELAVSCDRALRHTDGVHAVLSVASKTRSAHMRTPKYLLRNAAVCVRFDPEIGRSGCSLRNAARVLVWSIDQSNDERHCTWSPRWTSIPPPCHRTMTVDPTVDGTQSSEACAATQSLVSCCSVVGYEGRYPLLASSCTPRVVVCLHADRLLRSLSRPRQRRDRLTALPAMVASLPTPNPSDALPTLAHASISDQTDRTADYRAPTRCRSSSSRPGPER